ncbi:class III extradiol dioxygenase subunit B-like domain-containing protein [Streptomyces sp. ISL-10]|uniref:class III extradiol dioxygenase subunit B-like domain-containing protein n=1 Tax=Streptomyces sp. ISL-10 TaxID=2819172 RepID=UPI001BE8BDD7|nr:class III extradiol dioxygenase subunit B-like domain-containing protein [Streptomyces sp. ISL-10]MBT2363800.1 class III extradiol dioxygenase subunit B-like domain-containing protein [Streptomyces sp. ISL-10]
MLVAAAVCPCPPLLVPDIAAGAAPELDTAREACADAVGLIAAARPDLLLVVGPAAEAEHGTYPAGSRGSFWSFGEDLSVCLGVGPEQERQLPPSLAVAAWLLRRANWAACPVEGLGVDDRLVGERCAALGREAAERSERVAMLVMGDGSACRTLKAPGYLDERAAGFDRDAARALGAADAEALMVLDESLARELKAAGRAPWQVLAGAARGAGLEGRLLYEDAPYGVGYFVATWS